MRASHRLIGILIVWGMMGACRSGTAPSTTPPLESTSHRAAIWGIAGEQCGPTPANLPLLAPAERSESQAPAELDHVLLTRLEEAGVQARCFRESGHDLSLAVEVEEKADYIVVTIRVGSVFACRHFKETSTTLPGDSDVNAIVDSAMTELGRLVPNWRHLQAPTSAFSLVLQVEEAKSPTPPTSCVVGNVGKVASYNPDSGTLVVLRPILEGVEPEDLEPECEIRILTERLRNPGGPLCRDWTGRWEVTGASWSRVPIP